MKFLIDFTLTDHVTVHHLATVQAVHTHAHQVARQVTQMAPAAHHLHRVSLRILDHAHATLVPFHVVLEVHRSWTVVASPGKARTSSWHELQFIISYHFLPSLERDQGRDHVVEVIVDHVDKRFMFSLFDWVRASTWRQFIFTFTFMIFVWILNCDSYLLSAIHPQIKHKYFLADKIFDVFSRCLWVCTRSSTSLFRFYCFSVVFVFLSFFLWWVLLTPIINPADQIINELIMNQFHSLWIAN